MRLRVHILLAAVAALLCTVALAPIARAQDDMLISSDGVAGAIVGSTVDELADQLGDDYEISDEVRITVDFTGHVVSRDGTVQFRAVKANEPGDELSLFIVNNPQFKTAEGLGPGSTIAEGEAIYGNATLNRNPENESREFVIFDGQTDERIAFRTPGIAGTYVGEYDGEAIETDDYDPDGVIAAVWIACQPGNNCPADVDPSAGTDDGDDGGDDATGTDDGDDGGDDATGTDDGGDLPETGTESIVLVTAASMMLLLGGGFVAVNRSYLAPNWLGSRRW